MTINASPAAAAAAPVQQAQVVSVRTANGQIVQVRLKYLSYCFVTKGELTRADSDFCPMATPEHLMAYEFSYFINHYLCFTSLSDSRLSSGMVKALAFHLKGSGLRLSSTPFYPSKPTPPPAEGRRQPASEASCGRSVLGENANFQMAR